MEGWYIRGIGIPLVSMRDIYSEVYHWFRCNVCKTRRWGGGCTDSLSLGTEFGNYNPLFGHGQPLVLPSPNLQPPLFMALKTEQNVAIMEQTKKVELLIVQTTTLIVPKFVLYYMKLHS